MSQKKQKCPYCGHKIKSSVLKEYPKPEPYIGGYPPCYKESLCGGMGERACPMNQNYDYNTYKYSYKEGCPYRS